MGCLCLDAAVLMCFGGNSSQPVPTHTSPYFARRKELGKAKAFLLQARKRVAAMTDRSDTEHSEALEEQWSHIVEQASAVSPEEAEAHEIALLEERIEMLLEVLEEAAEQLAALAAAEASSD